MISKQPSDPFPNAQAFYDRMLESFQTPPWLRCIVTSRGETEITVPLQALAPRRLDGAAGQDSDIRSLVREVLKPPSETVAALLVKRSESNFLYLDWVRREMEGSRPTCSFDRPDAFPRGFGAALLEFFRRRFPTEADLERAARPVLEVVCAASEPIDVAMLEAMFEWNEYAQQAFFRSVGALFVERRDRLDPFHKNEFRRDCPTEVMPLEYEVEFPN